MNAKDRARIRCKQDRLLLYEVPRALRFGLDLSLVKLSIGIPNGPSLMDLQKFIYPELENTIDQLLKKRADQEV